NEEVLWVHIIHLDENKNPATSETIDSWYWDYPHDNIILLADPEAKMKKWIRPFENVSISFTKKKCLNT
ncbi:hypothetical protein, partial [Mesonia mobilis]|uniref:hypothetical protein n=1 Tax=Mesonia mobilis TaxID=369791 RepID=UPI0026EDD216